MSTKNTSILIVDDEEPLRDLLATLLGDDYDCATAANAEEAIALIENRSFNLVMSDIEMPITTGLDLCHVIHERRPETVLVMVSALSDIGNVVEAMRKGAFDYIVKPFDLGNVLMAVRRALKYQELVVAKQRHEEILEETVRSRTEELQQANRRLNGVNSALNQLLGALYSNYRTTLRALAETLEARDRATRGHSDRVVAICLRLGKEMGVSEMDMVGLEQGALLHDIGKIGVPDAVLLKESALTSEEWHQMREHIRYGLRIIDGVDFLAGARPIVGQHHEKYDGTGYPAGLSGEAIHIHARIFAVADAFDAITSDRPYRNRASYATARQEIVAGAGTHFDPQVMKAFLRVPEAEWSRISLSAAAPGYTEQMVDKQQIHSLILSLHRQDWGHGLASAIS